MRPPSVPASIPINADNDTKQTTIMKTLYNALIEHREPRTNRILIQHFMYLPSRKDFPEYFNIIEKPLSFSKVRDRIEKHYYKTLDDCLADFRLIFSNCRLFNEDESQIYRDSEELESILDRRKDKLLRQYNSHDSDINNHSTTDHHNQNQDSQTTTTHITSSTKHNNSTIALNQNNISSSRSNNIINNNNVNNHVSRSNNINSNNTNNINSIPESDSTNDSAPSDNPHQTNNHHIQFLSQQPQNKYQANNKSQHNGNDIHGHETPHRINHDHHNETSMDSSSNMSSDILGTSTPIEKCSLNKRRGRNPDKEKRLQLTGYIIYASEIRKEVIDKNPNQNFGDISRLVGNEWKALPDEIREKYNDRAKKHNNIVKVGRLTFGALKRDSEDGSHQNGVSTPKLSSRELARRTKEQMRQFHIHAAQHDDSITSSTSRVNHDLSPIVSRVHTHSTHRQQHSQAQPSAQISLNKIPTTESSTQTSVIRFVEPTTNRKRLAYSETFRKYIEGLEVPNRDLLVEETVPDRPTEAPKHWLGAGLGRHESTEAALWALRDFMLQDAVTMRRSMEPYL